MENKKLKRKYADIKNKPDIKKTKLKTMKVDTENFKGYISLLEFLEVRKEWLVDVEQRCILAKGYKWLEIYKEGANYCVTAMYNTNKEITEYYVDIAEKVGIQEDDDMPYEDDLYLDVIIVPDGRVFMLDEEELEEAYKEGLVTKEQYNLAYNVAKEIMKDAKERIPELKRFCDKYFEILDNKNNN